MAQSLPNRLHRRRIAADFPDRPVDRERPEIIGDVAILRRSAKQDDDHVGEDHIKIELKDRLDQLRSLNKLVEAQRLEQRTLFDLEMIMEVGYCSGIENYSRYLSGRSSGEPPPTMFDYLPDDAIVVVDESHVTIPQQYPTSIIISRSNKVLC